MNWPRAAPLVHHGPVFACKAVAIIAVFALGDLVRQGNLDGAVRSASQLSLADQAAALSSPDPDEALAVILAAPGLARPWELLPELARHAASWDRRMAAAAAEAGQRIAQTLTLEVALDHDLGDDLVERAHRKWLAIASARHRWADVRVLALSTATMIARSRAASADDRLGYDPIAFLHDPSDEVRRAALELIPTPTPKPLRPLLAQTLASETSESVALAAAQALCADLVSDAQGPILAALESKALTRLQALLSHPASDASAGALVDAARCLVADASAGSKRALGALQSHAPRSVRAAVRALGRR
jgi:hypothetical protein